MALNRGRLPLATRDQARSPCEPLGYRRQARHTAHSPVSYPHWGTYRGNLSPRLLLHHFTRPNKYKS